MSQLLGFRLLPRQPAQLFFAGADSIGADSTIGVSTAALGDASTAVTAAGDATSGTAVAVDAT